MPKSTESKLNVRLVREIQRHITEEPLRFFMGWYVATGTPGDSTFSECEFRTKDLPERVPACGTAACIAGWANILTGALPREADDVTRAEKALGLERVNTTVFSSENWPRPFSARYRRAKLSKTRARIACERLDYLIKTGE